MEPHYGVVFGTLSLASGLSSGKSLSLGTLVCKMRKKDSTYLIGRW